MRATKGITLIALVITIIVLLILAGITIGALSGNNGILRKANKAKVETQEANVKEKIQISAMSSYEKEGIFNKTIFKETIEKEGGKIIEENESKIIVELEKYEASIDVNNGEILTFSTIEEKQEYIKVVYIGTRGFTIEVDTRDKEISKFIYYVDGEQKAEKSENIFSIENLEPESTHIVKVSIEESDGTNKELEPIKVVTEPITYLYFKGNEFEDVTGGLDTYIRSFNNHYQNHEPEFIGNGKYSSGTVTKNNDNIYLTASHSSGDNAYGQTFAGIVTKNLIDFSKYKRLYIEADFYTNHNAENVIRFLNNDMEVKKGYGKQGKVCEELNLEDINESYYIAITIGSSATWGTNGNMTIKSIRVEK